MTGYSAEVCVQICVSLYALTCSLRSSSHPPIRGQGERGCVFSGNYVTANWDCDFSSDTQTV